MFRYAPWFAWLWVPLTYLPRTFVEWGWAAVLAGASIAILVALLRLRNAAAWALAFLITPWLLSLVQVGNIQPLVVAALAFGISRRSGPVWIGLTASLKFVPLAYVLIYVARRQFRRVAISVAMTAVFLAPFLLYDMSGYTTHRGDPFPYYYVGPAWAVTAAGSTAVAVWLALRRSPYVWVATAVAVGLLAPERMRRTRRP